MTAHSPALRSVRPAARPAARSDGSWATRLLHRLVSADRRYRERQYVQEMDDRMLRDIGVTRAELDRSIRNAEPWRFL